MMENRTEDREVLLRVEHLCQYFRLGKFAVNKAVDDLATEETTIKTAILTPEAFDSLALSNDWTFAQIEELGEILIKE